VLRLSGIPFITRLPGLPELPRGQQLELDILGGDEIDLALEARIHRLVEAEAEAGLEEVDDDIAADGTALESAATPSVQGEQAAG
jgi:exoribonuclease II